MRCPRSDSRKIRRVDGIQGGRRFIPDAALFKTEIMEKILLIDDSPMDRDVATRILSLANYKVLIAENGREGIELALQQHPDLILCDIEMPVLDGYGVLHLAQKHPVLRSKPFIFCSAVSDGDWVRRAMVSGADDFITKPYHGTDLLDAIECRLRKSRQSEEPELPGNDFENDDSQAAWKRAIQTLTYGRNTHSLTKRQVVYKEGQRVQKVYYILKGKVRTYLRNEQGKELAIELLGPGDFLGHEGLLSEGIYRESAETMEETELAIIPHEDIERMLQEHEGVRMAFCRMLCKSITRKERLLVIQAYDSLRRKVAQALLRLYKKFGKLEPSFEINLSREIMASIAGTATESLIRTLGDFKSEGLIHINSKGVISIKDIRRLDAIYC
jgi:CRP/FNR family cyclic AMP-dependent transcriptional regulator